MAVVGNHKVISASSLVDLESKVNAFLVLNPTYLVLDTVNATGKNGNIIYSQTLVAPPLV